MFKKSRDPGRAGHDGQAYDGPALAGVTMVACSQFEARFLLIAGQGGRRTPVFNHYRPTFRFDASYVQGTVTFPEGTEMVMPGGDWTDVTIQLAQAALMEAGMHFSIHEGDRTVGTGQVTRIIGLPGLLWWFVAIMDRGWGDVLGAVRGNRVGRGVGGENVPVQVIQAGGLMVDGRVAAQAPEWVGGGLVASYLGVLGAVGGGVLAQREDLVQVVDELDGGRRRVAAGAVVMLDHARGPSG